MRPRWLLAGIVLFGLLFFGYIWLYRHTTRYDRIITLSAARYDLDFYLVKAVVSEESWFRPDIRGTSGEIGLMQISMAAATDYSTRKGFLPLYEARLFEPELNVEIGCWYLRQSIDRYRKTPDPTLFALLRYNAGEVRADKWLRAATAHPVPKGVSPERYYLSLVDFPKTREYAHRILAASRSHNFWF
jgi:soluble lytic murein transglycosylase